MGDHHPTCPFCHSSTVEGYRCYILRAIFLRGSPRLWWGFIGGSLPRATVGVPGGRYRSVAERVLSYTAVGLVLGHPRRCVMRLWGSKRVYVCPLRTTLQEEPDDRGEGIPEDALGIVTP